MRHMRQFDNHHLLTYSSFLDWLQDLPLKRASASQWMATIKNLSSVRREEKERSGLFEFLQDVPPQEMVAKTTLTRVAEPKLACCHPVLLTERMMDYLPDLYLTSLDPQTIPMKVKLTFRTGTVFRACVLNSFRYRVIGVKYQDMLGSGKAWLLYDNRWRPIYPGMFRTAVDAIDAAYEAAKTMFSGYASPAPANRYERYSLLGEKTQYREWLLQLPKVPGGYVNHHFDLDNVVLHLRTSVRTNDDGYQMLLVDEMQSDWHAKGRDFGYLKGKSRDPGNIEAVPDAPFSKEWHELAIKTTIWIAAKSGISTVGFTTGDIQCERWGEFDGLRNLYDAQVPRVLDNLIKNYGGYLYWADVTVRKPAEDIHYRSRIGWEVPALNNSRRRTIIKNEIVAMRYWQARAVQAEETVLAMDISPSLASLVKNKGVPIFGWWNSQLAQ